MLHVLERSRESDPMGPHLAAKERLARSIRDLDAARSRLGACGAAGPPDSSALDAEAGELRVELTHARAADADLLQRALQLVLRVEAAAQTCGEGTALDRALVRIARRRASGTQ
jgi:hypothetical protein